MISLLEVRFVSMPLHGISLSIFHLSLCLLLLADSNLPLSMGHMILYLR